MQNITVLRRTDMFCIKTNLCPKTGLLYIYYRVHFWGTSVVFMQNLTVLRRTKTVLHRTKIVLRKTKIVLRRTILVLCRTIRVCPDLFVNDL